MNTAVRLGAVAAIERDGVNPSTISFGTPYVGLENISSDGSLVDVRSIDPGEVTSTKFAFTDRHILFGKLRPYLRKTAKPSFAGICSTDIIPIAPSEKLDRSYLFHFLRTDRVVKMATALSTGANLPRLSPHVLLEFEIPLPSLRKQQRIAAILEFADAIRQKRSRSLNLIDELSESIFLQLFGDPIANPKGWETSRMGKLDIRISDGNYAEKYPTSADFVSDGVPFIRAVNIAAMSVSSQDIRHIREKKHLELRKGHLLAGDVLLTTRGEIGKVAIVPRRFAGSNINAQIVSIRPMSDQVNSYYLAYLLNSRTMRWKLRSLETGVALKQLPLGVLRSVEIPVPPVELQKKFAANVHAVAGYRLRCESALVTSTNLVRSLQHQLFYQVVGDAEQAVSDDVPV